jgi:hypothetical protein
MISVALPLTAKIVGKIALSALIYLAVFDVVGVLLCMFLDIFFPASQSAALFYAVWFVLGVFCGMLCYSGAGDIAGFKAREGIAKAGITAIAAMFVIGAAISLASYGIWWRYGVEDSYFVPDSEPHTLTFFTTVLAAGILAHRTMRREPSKAPT